MMVTEETCSGRVCGKSLKRVAYGVAGLLTAMVLNLAGMVQFIISLI